MTASLFKIAWVLALAYLGLVLLLAGCQRKLIYHPYTASKESLLSRAQSERLEPWRNTAGELIGWKSVPSDTGKIMRTALIFHGNAGFALHRVHFVSGFQALPGDDPWAVYLFEYPGYGARSGRPSEKSFQEAAEAAFADVQQQLGSGPIILVGESLGGGVASHIAARHPEQVDGLVMMTPFTTLADVGRHHFPYFPVRLLLRERYDNVTALGQYQGPVAFILAENDEVVPSKLGQTLYEGYPGPKLLRIEKGGTHNTLPFHPQAPWWRETMEFLSPQPGR